MTKQDDTERATIRIDYDAVVSSDDMPHIERTRADGTPWRTPDGWSYQEIVAVIIEAKNSEIINIEAPFEFPRGPDDRPKCDCIVIDGTQEIDDERVELITQFEPDGSPSRTEGDTTTEQFSLDDALDKI
ncbi:hypothetical protein [Haloquadratum walsbyi]|uniref:Uncharacterized protein n=1 Tax=Haloquadratum walsbyi J07HQW2 TaxID=1238425 RepID=U1PTC7_9EURY|nr:hypothetical protein [Haloquadratum walsbyi]ERG97052.1 MAG: hypothetical protein J07HQW2_03538 [Haloquadratum walsbyi J07HQW2]